VFVNIPGIPFMHALNAGLRDTLDTDAFHARLTANLALLDRLAGELAGEALMDAPDADLGVLADLPRGPVELLATVFPLLRRVRA
jgi:hypothetical protein